MLKHGYGYRYGYHNGYSSKGTGTNFLPRYGYGYQFRYLCTSTSTGMGTGTTTLIYACINTNRERLSIGNTWFQKGLIQKNTREGENGQERSLIAYVLEDEKRKNLLEDVNVYGCAAGGMSDNYLAEAKVRMKGLWKREREEVTAKRVVRVTELEKDEVKEAFLILIVNEWDRIRNARVLSVEEQRRMFRSTVMTCAASVCGCKSIGRKKKGRTWWDEEIKEMVREKRMPFEIYGI